MGQICIFAGHRELPPDTAPLYDALLRHITALYDDGCTDFVSGGAMGFRDQLQDRVNLIPLDAPGCRDHILRSCAHQFREGDVQHWWHPYGAGVRTRISDDLLFLPYVTARYVYVTGEKDILQARAAWLSSPVLTEEEHDRYETAEETNQTAQWNACADVWYNSRILVD